MHRFISLCLCLGCILAVVPSRLRAECPTGAYAVLVQPGRDGQPIAKGPLLAAAPGFQIVGYSQPQVGVVLESADFFSYQPSTQFWTLGTDSFTVHLAPVSGRVTQDSVRARTVFLVSALGPAENLAEGFEGRSISNWISEGTHGQLQLFTDNALSGQQSLRIRESTVVGSWIKARLEGREGGGQQGSGAEATFRPPGSGGPGNFGDPYEVAFFSAGRPAAPDYRLWLRDGAGFEIRAELPGVPVPAFTPWIPISRSVHRFRITRWKGNADRAGGSFLWIDGALVAELTATANEGLYPEFRLGSLGAEGAPAVAPGEIALDVDDVYLYITRLDRPSSLCLAADGFEGRQIGSGWVVPPGVSATAAAALDGSSGLEVDVEAATDLMMEIATPTPSRRYGARFRLDPNTIDLSTSGQLLLFRALAANGLTAVKLLLEPASSGYQLRALSQDDSGIFRSTSHPLSDEPHTLSVDWQRATGEQAPTGSLRLWIDGTLAGELTGLANVSQEIAGAYLGALLVEGTGSGIVYLDGFEAWQGVP